MLPHLSAPPLSVPSGNENVVWVEPLLVCTVKYMPKSEFGSLREPVFKGLRNDKARKNVLKNKLSLR